MMYYQRFKTVDQRFWEKVIRRGDNECWEWSGTHDTAGYGRFHINQQNRREGAHRMAYQLLIGPIPEGLEPDHTCRDKGCVNPYHLELVTHAENVVRGIKASPRKRKTRCPQGHALEGDNLYIYIDRHGRESHLCKQCRRTQWLASKRRRAA